MINSTLDVYPLKPFILANIPESQQCFPIVRMVSAEFFFLLRHVSPRLLRVAWLIGNKVSISLWLIPLHRRAHPILGCAPGTSRKKKHWPDSSPSCGRPSSPQLLSLLPSLAAQLWWKKARAEMLVLVRGFLVGLYPKGSSYSRRFLLFFFFFKDESPIPMLPHLLKNFWPSHTASGVLVLWPGIEPICIKVLCTGSAEPS